MRILVTGGAGFIGSALVKRLLESDAHDVLVLDKLTYAADRSFINSVMQHPRLQFVPGDIGDPAVVADILNTFQPQAISHLAAETHVDRSIDSPEMFIQSNIVGTFLLLQEVLKYWRALPDAKAASFRFHHISTDEVFGSLGGTGAFTEQTPYDPRSPYSASKASSDHLVRAWGYTYGLPVLVTNCSNNYGPRQHFEKLIPLTIRRALAGLDIPVYGDGLNVRDWLHVDDHARALECVLNAAAPGSTYNIGGQAERTTLQVVGAVCETLDQTSPRVDGRSYACQIALVPDRPGHDRRYAIDAAQIRHDLNWAPEIDFDKGIGRTVEWYLNNAVGIQDREAALQSTMRRGLP